MAKSKDIKYKLQNKDPQFYERVIERARAARKEKIERLASRGVPVSDEEWEEGEDPPEELNEYEKKAPSNRDGESPSEEEIALLARSVRKDWDRQTERVRMGAFAPSRVQFDPVPETKDKRRGRKEDY